MIQVLMRSVILVKIMTSCVWVGVFVCAAGQPLPLLSPFSCIFLPLICFFSPPCLCRSTWSLRGRSTWSLICLDPRLRVRSQQCHVFTAANNERAHKTCILKRVECQNCVGLIWVELKQHYNPHFIPC